MKLFTILSVAALGFALAGCKTGSVNTVSSPGGGGYTQTDTDPALAREVKVVDVRQSRTATGFLQIQAQLLNDTTDPVEIRFRFRWTDANGIVLSGLPATWEYRFIDGGAMEPVTAISRYADAEGYIIDMKYAE